TRRPSATSAQAEARPTRLRRRPSTPASLRRIAFRNLVGQSNHFGEQRGGATRREEDHPITLPGPERPAIRDDRPTEFGIRTQRHQRHHTITRPDRSTDALPDFRIRSINTRNQVNPGDIDHHEMPGRHAHLGIVHHNDIKTTLASVAGGGRLWKEEEKHVAYSGRDHTPRDRHERLRLRMRGSRRRRLVVETHLWYTSIPVNGRTVRVVEGQ